MAMFIHSGKARSFRHNIRVAVFLSFTAGLVNVTGVLALGILTTNVTGHFAYFAEGVFTRHTPLAVYYLFFILAFLAGSFTSSLLTEYAFYRQYRAPYIVPVVIEILLLLITGLMAATWLIEGMHKQALACVLLFTMGLQNALVSKVSSSAVRTTHLTGLFTDLGIELSQLFFHRQKVRQRRLLSSIMLRLGIIVFFFSGCITGGLLFGYIGWRVLIIGAVVLIIALVYSRLLLIYYRLTRRMFKLK